MSESVEPYIISAKNVESERSLRVGTYVWDEYP